MSTVLRLKPQDDLMRCWGHCLVGVGIVCMPLMTALAEPPAKQFAWATAYVIPKHTTAEGSGYFSIIEGKPPAPDKAGRLYIGTARYGSNAYLVEFEPANRQMNVVVDAQKEIGTSASGFAAQAKFHTRNNLGESGKIYLGTKQGYPKEGEKRSDYPGGYPMVYDPATGKTRVYPIPIPHQGIISVTPDESRKVAYISTCSDERPVESTHFMILDLKSGAYRDLLDCRHSYAFIVVDFRGRAYHPMLGGQIARFDPTTDRLEKLDQTIDGKPPSAESLLAHSESHPINWDISPDRTTLFAVAMSGNQLYAYDLTGDGTLKGRSLGKLLPAARSTDCRAMCVGPHGDVWAAVLAKIGAAGEEMHLVSYHPADSSATDRGAIAIRNPDYTEMVDAQGKALPWHHGIAKTPDGVTVPKWHMGICQTHDLAVYVTVIYPFTLLEIRFPNQR